MVYDALLWDALGDNKHIQSVTLLDFTHNRDDFKPFFSVIPSLKNLRHLQNATDAEFRKADLRALESTLEKTNALESLHIPGLWNYDMDSTDLLTAIAGYASLRELALNFSFLERTFEDSSDDFSAHLKNSGALTMLSLDGDCDFRDACGKRVLRALRDNESILNLKLEDILLDNDELDLMAGVFAKNTVLRSFQIHSVCNFSLIRCRSFVDIWADFKYNAPQLMKLTTEVSAVNHVTSLTLSISPHPGDVDPLSPIASLIGAKATLKTLRLFVTATDKAGNYTNVSWTAIIESLSRNQSISKLRIGLHIVKAEGIEKLGDVIRLSDNIRRLGVIVEDPVVDFFPKRFSRGIFSNYTLVSVEFLDHSDPNTFAVLDTARRNSGLVARASRLRMGPQLE
ncbi:hypothetical protein V5799_014601, partial [Amblyomma americanum]